jgi:hypothetical protein
VKYVFKLVARCWGCYSKGGNSATEYVLDLDLARVLKPLREYEPAWLVGRCIAYKTVAEWERGVLDSSFVGSSDNWQDCLSLLCMVWSGVGMCTCTCYSGRYLPRYACVPCRHCALTEEPTPFFLGGGGAGSAACSEHLFLHVITPTLMLWASFCFDFSPSPSFSIAYCGRF